MLVRAEENDRGLFETFVYGMLMLSAVIGIWQFAHIRVPAPFASKVRIGRANAAVFPVPVWAVPMRSFPERTIGKARS